MPIEVQVSSIAYTGDGAQLDFPTTFSFGEASDLTVVVDDVVKTLDVDYTVAGAGAAEPGGTVSFLVAPANGADILIERNTPITQLTNFVTSGPFSAATITRAFDKLTRICQSLLRRVLALEAITTPATISAGSIVFADKTFATGAEVEDSFPMNVAVASGSTATGCWAVRLRNLDEPAEVFDEPPAIQWAPGVGSNVSLQRCSGLRANTNYTLRIAAVIP